MHSIKTTILALLLAPTLLQAEGEGMLTLQQAVSEALARNMDLRIQRYDPFIARQTLGVEEAAFDIILNADAGLYNANSALDGSSTTKGSLSAGATKKTVTGATLGLTTTLDHNSALAKDSSSSITASISQPILRGARKEVVLADLNKASSQLSQAQLQLRSNALDLVLEVNTRYWNLSYAKQQVRLLESSVKSAELLLDESRAKLKAGLVSEIELLQAMALLSERREALTKAQLATASAADELAQGMGTLLELGGTSFEPTVAELPTNMGAVTPFGELWPLILERDLASAMQEETIRRAYIDHVKAGNARLPQLDLILQAGLSGADKSEYDSLGSLMDRDGRELNTQLKFSMPLGRKAEIAQSRQAAARLEQERIRLVAVKESLYKNARNTWRDLQLGVDRCYSGKARVDYQLMALEKARSSFSANLISFRELIDAQKDYDDAQLVYLDSLRDLTLARAGMARLDGTLFDESLNANSFNPSEITSE